MKLVLEFFSALPIGLWTALNGLISFFAAVLVVYLTNRANDNRLRRQFINDQKIKFREHQRERALKKRERDLQLRQEVYLDAVAAMQAGFAAIQKIGDLDVAPQDALVSFMDKSPALAKLQIVAGLPAIAASLKLSGALGHAHIRLMSARMPLDAERATNDFTGQHLKSRRAEIEGLQEKVKGLIDTAPDRVKLIDRIAFEQASVVDMERKYGRDLELGFQKQLTLLQRCTDAATEMWPLIAAAIIEIRLDLELPLDEKEFMTMFGESAKSQFGLIDKFVEDIKASRSVA